MSKSLLAITTTIVVVALFGPANAAPSRYCLQGDQWGYPGNCQFATYRQCRAAASGTNAECGINPRHAGRRHSRSPSAMIQRRAVEHGDLELLLSQAGCQRRHAASLRRLDLASAGGIA